MKEKQKKMDRERLVALCDACYMQPGHTMSPITVAGYSIVLRYSWPAWRAQDGHRYNTLDVVQIHWSLTNSTERPKRGAAPIWEILEDWCRSKGLSLRVECVMFEKVRLYLLSEERGFIRQVNTECCFIKPLGPTH